MAISDKERRARLDLVLEHVRAENAHDVDAIMKTLGDQPKFRLNSEGLPGRKNVRAFYEDFLRGFPDARFDVEHQHVSDDAVIADVALSGTHKAARRGVATTGRRVKILNCIVYAFDQRGKLAAERVYFDEALMLRQLGVLPEVAA